MREQHPGWHVGDSIHRCKVCDREFHRRSGSKQSKDYCSLCRDSLKQRHGEDVRTAKLTWNQVDEIRCLSATEHCTQKEMAERYGVSESTIGLIIHNLSWKPKHNPRHKEPPA